MEGSMVKQKISRQSWWPVYILVLMIVGLLFLAPHVAPAPGWCTFLEIVIVIVDYGLIMGWLETHPNLLAPQPPAEAGNPAVKSPHVEMLSAGSPHIRYEFYAGSDQVLFFEEPEASNGHLRSNAQPLPTGGVSRRRHE
jgi:hypothetical protein